MQTQLTRKEFSSALGMKENDNFVGKMFKIVDGDKNGKISFQVSFFLNNVQKLANL